jgi:scyllo-inositol 2-dehydrogenase (NADP+)
LAKKAAAWFETHDGPVGWAVIGLGMGRVHAGYIARSPGLRLVALCDLKPSALAAAGKDHPDAAQYQSIAELLRDERVEGVSVVIPHNQHAREAVRCMRAGRHVVVDKPFCLTVAEGKRMLATARETRRLLSAFHNRRWDADFVTIRGLVDRGVIGEVRYLESRISGAGRLPNGVWRADRKQMGGLLYDWPAHLMDQALFLIRARPVQVSCVAQRDLPERAGDDVEERIQATIRFSNGAVALVGWALASPAPMPRFIIEGERGGIRSDEPVHSFAPPTAGSVTVFTEKRGGKVVSRAVKLVKTDWSAYYRNVGAALAGKAELAVLPEQAIRHVAIAECAYRSVRSGKPVDLPADLFQER